MQTLRDTYRRSRWLMPAVALALGGSSSSHRGSEAIPPAA